MLDRMAFDILANKMNDYEEYRKIVFNEIINISNNLGQHLKEYEFYDSTDFEIRDDGINKTIIAWFYYYAYQDSQQDRTEFSFNYFWDENYIETENKKKEEENLRKKFEEKKIKKEREEKKLKEEYEKYLYLKDKFEKG